MTKINIQNVDPVASLHSWTNEGVTVGNCDPPCDPMRTASCGTGAGDGNATAVNGAAGVGQEDGGRSVGGTVSDAVHEPYSALLRTGLSRKIGRGGGLLPPTDAGGRGWFAGGSGIRDESDQYVYVKTTATVISKTADVTLDTINYSYCA